jgi:hypothetical protein
MALTEIAVEDELLEKLSEALFWQEYHHRPPRRDGDLRGVEAALIVARVYGLSIKIKADEHPPPHFHVSYQGEDASFSILDGVRLPGVKGLERYERTIRSWWQKNQNLLVDKWNVLRPTDCPVGLITLPHQSN